MNRDFRGGERSERDDHQPHPRRQLLECLYDLGGVAVLRRMGCSWYVDYGASNRGSGTAPAISRSYLVLTVIFAHAEACALRPAIPLESLTKQ
jgi:hypothetical protein